MGKKANAFVALGVSASYLLGTAGCVRPEPQVTQPTEQPSDQPAVQGETNTDGSGTIALPQNNVDNGAGQAVVNPETAQATALPDTLQMPGLVETDYTWDVWYTRANAIPTVIEQAGIPSNLRIEPVAATRLMDLVEQVLPGSNLFTPEDSELIGQATLSLRDRSAVPIRITAYNENITDAEIRSRLEERGLDFILSYELAEVRRVEVTNETQVILPIRQGDPARHITSVSTLELNAKLVAQIVQGMLTTQVGDVVRDENLTELMAGSVGYAYAIAVAQKPETIQDGSAYVNYTNWLYLAGTTEFGKITEGRALAVTPETFAQLYALGAVISMQ